jgi:oxygen-independent coproporphyrinogen III oxidase
VIGIYLHIPFCAAICNYCNFNRGLLDGPLKARYVEALVAEIRGAAEPDTPADTIFFGGGTPSLLEPEEVARLIEACRAAFAVTADAEVTLEANPETVDAPRLAGFRQAGVTRLSFGVQSFHDDELTRLGRLHTAARARQALADARAVGFDNVSLDLMMWLPGQSVDGWLSSVDALIAGAPDHASLYLLEIYPNAPLRDEMARGGWSVAPDEDAAAMYLEAMTRLDAAGYEQYEISNVARPGRRSRHNLKYWEDGAWLGFGCGAHSTRGAARWHNVAGTGEYVARLEQGRSVHLDLEARTPAERAEEAMFLGLRLADGLDLGGIRRAYGVDVWNDYGKELAGFVEAGLLWHRPGERLGLTREGMLVANEIMMVFIGRCVR